MVTRCPSSVTVLVTAAVSPVKKYVSRLTAVRPSGGWMVSSLAGQLEGIEHGCDRQSGFAVSDGVVVSRMGDGYRFVDQGTAYLKRFWGIDLNDGFIELDDWTGDAFIYDCLVEVRPADVVS